MSCQYLCPKFREIPRFVYLLPLSTRNFGPLIGAAWKGLGKCPDSRTEVAEDARSRVLQNILLLSQVLYLDRERNWMLGESELLILCPLFSSDF